MSRPDDSDDIDLGGESISIVHDDRKGRPPSRSQNKTPKGMVEAL